jgi:hypothetical protein
MYEPLPNPAGPRIQLTFILVTITSLVILAVFTGLGFYRHETVPVFNDGLECGALHYNATSRRVVSAPIDLAGTDECSLTGNLPFDRIDPNGETGCLVSNGTHSFFLPCDGSGIIELNDTDAVLGVLGVQNGGTGAPGLDMGIVKSIGPSSPLITETTIDLDSEVSGVLDPAYGGSGTASLAAGYLKSPGAGQTYTSVATIPFTDTTGTVTVNRGGTGTLTYSPGFVVSTGGTTPLSTVPDIDLSSDVSSVLGVTNGGTGATGLDAGIVKSIGSSSPLITEATIDLASEVSGVLGAVNGGSGTASLSAGYLKSPGAGQIYTSTATIPFTDTTGTVPVSRGGTDVTTFTAGFVKSPGGTTALTTVASINLASDVTGVLQLTHGGLGHSSFTTGYLLANNSDITSVYPIPSADIASNLVDKTLSGTTTILDVGTDATLYIDNGGELGGIRYEFGTGFNVTTTPGTPTIIHIEVANFTVEGGEVTSIVPISFGGTGQSFLDNGIMQVNLGVVSSATAPVKYGGTGITTYAVGDILYATGATTLAKLALGSAGQILNVNAGVGPSWGALNLGTTSFSGCLGSAYGGTGLCTYPTGAMLTSTGNTTWGLLIPTITGNALISSGIDASPVWGKIGLTTHVSGILPATHGGTGFGTGNTYTAGDMLYASGSTTLARVPANAATTNSVLHYGSPPTWGAVVLTSQVSGTLPVANGGTGQTSFNQGAIVLGAGTSNPLGSLAAVALGSVLISQGTSTDPAWGKVSLTAHIDTATCLPSLNGGTGFGTCSNYVTGDMLYASGTTTLARVPANTATTNSILHYGSPPTWGAVVLTSQVSGTLPVGNGGTGQTSFALGSIVLGAGGGTALGSVAAAASGNVLISQGTSSNPTWDKVGLTTHVTGTLAVGNGGTGQTSIGVGAILVGNGASALGTVSASVVGNVLLSAGVSTNPSWGKVNLAVHVTDVLLASNGGTGLSTYAVGDLLYANATTPTLDRLPAVATGNALISGGVNTAPSWGKIGLTTHVTGILPATHGGTGYGTATPYAVGDMLYASGLTALSKLAAGNSTSFLRGGASAPSWSKINLLTDVWNVLPQANGGTGQSSYTAGQILYANIGATLSKLNIGTTGNVLVAFSGLPAWGYVDLSSEDSVTNTLGVTHGGTGLSTIAAGQIIYGSADDTYSILGAGNTTSFLRGSATGPTWAKINLGTDVVGTTLAVNGGTGFASYTTGDLLYASSSSALTRLGVGGTGNRVLRNGPSTSATVPTWGQVVLTSDVTGVLGVANGGTGFALYSIGDIIYSASGGASLATLSVGSTGNLVLRNGPGSSALTPTWGQVRLVSDVTGTLPAANGGTGFSTWTTGQLLYASASNTLAQRNIGSANQVLRTGTGGTASVPTWGSVILSTDVTGVLAIANGGTGQSTYTDGQIMIGNSATSGLTKATLTAGTGINILNGNGVITIELDPTETAIWYITEQGSGASCPGDTVASPSRTTRPINTISSTTGSSAITLDTPNQEFTISTAGTYDIEVTMPGYQCGWFFAILVLSSGGDYAYGTIGVASLLTDVHGFSTIQAKIEVGVLDVPMNFQIEHQAQVATVNGHGWCGADTGYVRKYTHIKITKITDP